MAHGDAEHEGQDGHSRLLGEVNRWQKKFAKDVVIVGITDEDPALIRLFMKEFPMDYAVAVDQKHQMSGAFQVRGFPHVVVISPDGIVRWQGYPGTRNDMLTEKVIAQIVAASKS
jgi:cytochrome c biogenesis protein CcmG, thiol:disulfide interchange protein DsbE